MAASSRLWGRALGGRPEEAGLPLADENALAQDKDLNVSFTVPADAKSGDYFNLILEARNEHENPMTGYGQAIVTVE